MCNLFFQLHPTDLFRLLTQEQLPMSSLHRFKPLVQNGIENVPSHVMVASPSAEVHRIPPELVGYCKELESAPDGMLVGTLEPGGR
ncbi:hypothetical protein LIER_29631 [Lithospermum erythrorhizon]|uniref:Uncharacterized protein n=1 Tax=Lithospermum erythrorhizon TaxID=34254 RepID=A0AAV3RLR5_LITER